MNKVRIPSLITFYYHIYRPHKLAMGLKRKKTKTKMKGSDKEGADVSSHKALNKETNEDNPADATEAPHDKERTFVAIKPDGVQRKLVGEIIARFEKRGYKLVALKMISPVRSLLEEHYNDLSSKPFFEDLIGYMLSGPIVATVWEGDDVVKQARRMVGETNPLESSPGTIRGDYSIQIGRNIIHGSDSESTAQREISLWFGDHELNNWQSSDHCWIYE
ncbi:nucleoside diphosphate kinase-like [Convolutriloba macropyga]|uniref:nucleoside diphosphate kinase-like n=1 Tax=Convolutriloba macropyga TaxID=536237 RepID=UPI003F524F38